MEFSIFLIFTAIICTPIFLFGHRMDNLHDRSKGEPVLTEKARLHAKEEYGKYGGIKYLNFYIPERDTVVVCKVPDNIWTYLPKGDWGMLCHQGGTFFSFTRDCNGEVITANTIHGNSLNE
ncbi:MAG: DUF2500 domain-containing protein [Lawsonibacter sp.]|nr:DUF2500 domain-containing protein [Lawsonibacter sp.]